MAIELGPWVETLEGADVCIHLSGRSVNCRYTARNRRELYDSRIGPTRLLHHAFATLANPPRLWMNASTATIYRHARLDRDMDEATGEIGGNETDHQLAAAALPKSGTGPCSLSRIGRPHSSPSKRRARARSRCAPRSFSARNPGSIFAVLSRLVRFGLGGTQGNGRQYVSWIHEADFARASSFSSTMKRSTAPSISPRPIRCPTANSWPRCAKPGTMPNGLPAPAPLIAIGMFFLRSEPELVLKSRRVVPGRLLQSGFQFEFPNWPEAAADLVRQWRARDDL